METSSMNIVYCDATEIKEGSSLLEIFSPALKEHCETLERFK